MLQSLVQKYIIWSDYLEIKKALKEQLVATEFGDVYEAGTKVTLKSIPEFYSDFVC